MVSGQEFYPDCPLERHVPSYKPKHRNQHTWTASLIIRSDYLDIWIVAQSVHTEETYYPLSSVNINLGHSLHSVDVLHPLYLANHYVNQIVDRLLEDGVAEQPVLLYR